MKAFGSSWLIWSGKRLWWLLTAIENRTFPGNLQAQAFTTCCWPAKARREEPGYSSGITGLCSPKAVLRSLPATVLVDRLVFSSADRFVGGAEHDLWWWERNRPFWPWVIYAHCCCPAVTMCSGMGFRNCDAQFAHLRTK